MFWAANMRLLVLHTLFVQSIAVLSTSVYLLACTDHA